MTATTTTTATSTTATPIDQLRRAASLFALDVRLRAPAFLSWTFFRRRERGRKPLPIPEAEPLGAGAWRLRLGVEPAPPAIAVLSASADAPPPAQTYNHLELRLPARAGERFVGFGERFHAVDQRGRRLETWTEEGAIGLGERLSRWLTRLGVRWSPFPKGPTTAYKPLPWFISSRGYALLLDTSAPVFFDVAASDPAIVRCEVAAPEVEALVLAGEPLALVEALVRATGRPPGLPDWALAPWHDAIGGEAEVRRVARLLRDRGIPSGVIWTEDWQGGRFTTPWLGRFSTYDIFPVYRRPCPRLYPAIERLAADLHAGGHRFLAYFYPYVAKIDPDYAEAEARGYFLREARASEPSERGPGERHVRAEAEPTAGPPSSPAARPRGAVARTAIVRMLWYATGQVDFTEPEARAWYQRFLEQALRLGFDGWMGDFGEYTPWSSVTASGETGREHRNRYPRLWAEVQRDAIRAAGREGDAVFFSRSSAIGQQAVTPIFWSGDSNTDFERWDGLPSNLRGLLSAGLSGMPCWTVDAGGYTSLWTRARDAETLMRWTELAALLVVLRTHHGTHPRRSVQFDHDDATLAHHRTYARLHAALFPLRRALVDEAVERGTPVARALLLHHADDDEAWAVEDEYLLGEHLLVAPILVRGAREREVYLPRGRRWIDLWSGVAYEGGRRVIARAPLGVIPLYLRADGFLPIFDTEVDTFDRRERARMPGLRTLDDAERSLALIVGPDFAGPATLYDGSEVRAGERAGDRAGERAGERAGDVDGEPALDPADRPTSPPPVLPSGLAAVLTWLGSGEGDAGWLALTTAAPSARQLWVGAPTRPGAPARRRISVYRAG